MQQIPLYRQRFVKTILTSLLLALALSSAAQPTQGYFGAQLDSAKPGEGVTVISTLPGSPAHAAGLRADDRILQIDQQRFHKADEFAAYIRAQSPGTSLKIVVSRPPDQTNKSLTLTLGTNPWQDVDAPDPALTPIRVRTDLAYTRVGVDDSSRHQLDLYLPQTPQPAPALLWIHGGGWSFGNKTEERALALRFAERGIAVAVINYRLSAGRWADPQAPATGVTHPAHINDVADAFAWLRSHAPDLGLDPARLFVGGHSAGGHLAALLASDERYLQSRGLSFAALAGAVPIGGAYDINDYHQALIESDPELGRAHIHAVFGTSPAQWISASPTTYLAESTVPMLVVVEDQAGFQRYARQLQNAADAAKRNNVEFLYTTDRTHGNILLLMRGRHEDPVRARIISFLRNS